MLLFCLGLYGTSIFVGDDGCFSGILRVKRFRSIIWCRCHFVSGGRNDDRAIRSFRHYVPCVYD